MKKMTDEEKALALGVIMAVGLSSLIAYVAVYPRR